MLLISPTEAAAAIGARCGGAQVSENEPELAQILSYLTPRVEAAMNVASLTRGYYRDRFILPAMPTNIRYNSVDPVSRLRLSNGYVLSDSLSLYGPDGEEVNVEKYLDIDFKYGIVNVSRWQAGVYFAEYVSGFEPEAIPDTPPDGYDPNMRVLQEVPDGIKAMVVNLVVLWYRTTRLNPRIPKDVSYSSLMNHLRRELASTVYGFYQRPRADCLFGEAR